MDAGSRARGKYQLHEQLELYMRQLQVWHVIATQVLAVEQEDSALALGELRQRVMNSCRRPVGLRLPGMRDAVEGVGS